LGKQFLGWLLCTDLLAVPDDLLNLSAVYLLGPAALCVQDSPVDEYCRVCIYLHSKNAFIS